MIRKYNSRTVALKDVKYIVTKWACKVQGFIQTHFGGRFPRNLRKFPAPISEIRMMTFWLVTHAQMTCVHNTSIRKYKN